MTFSRRIHLDDVDALLAAGNTITTIAHRLGVQPASIARTAWAHGTPQQRQRIARARAAEADEKRAAVAAANRVRARLQPRDPAGHFASTRARLAAGQ